MATILILDFNGSVSLMLCVAHNLWIIEQFFFSVHRSMRQLSLPCFDIIGHMQFLDAIIFCVRSLVGSSQALVSSNVPEFAIAFHFFLSNLAVFLCSESD